MLAIPSSQHGITVTVSDSNGVDDSSCLYNSTGSINACRTLSYAFQGIITSSISSVEINVLNGQYNLTSNDLFTFDDMNMFSLSGQGMNYTIITCDHGNGGGILFNKSRNIFISNVSIIGCGDLSGIQRAALNFINCTNISLLGVHVSMSMYSAVKIESFNGKLAIGDSVFDDNGWSNDTEKGGATQITVYGNTDTEITISSCLFINNTAITGGAVYIEILEQHNTFTLVAILDSNLTSNRAYTGVWDSRDMSMDGHGGAVHIVIGSDMTIVTILRSTISHNTATSGAGVNFYIRNGGAVNGSSALMTVTESRFISNTASVGSAMVLSSLNVNCNKQDKVILDGNVVSNNTAEDGSGHEIGTIILRYISVLFKGRNEFGNNQKSAFVFLNAVGHFMQGSETTFTNNSGFNGGALQMYGESSLTVDSDSSLAFIGNTVTHKGGAIYYETFDNIFSLPRDCFFQITNSSNIFFTFLDNHARNVTNALYSNAVSSCIIPGDEEGSIVDSLLFCQKNWHYISSNCNESIESEPVDFILSNLTNSVLGLYSNVRTSLPVMVIDIFETNVTDDITLNVNTISKANVYTNPSSGVVSNNTIELIGNQESTGIIHLQTTSTPYKTVDIPFSILLCPPGFRASNGSTKCQCVENAYTEGALTCDENALTSKLQITNCMSQLAPNDSTLVVGSCPFLMSSATSATIPLPQDPYEVEEAVCGKMNRRGVLCGQCKQGYVPEAYSYQYTCIKCDHIARSWVVYLSAQYIPILVLFLLITFFRLTIVSPASNAFLFFCQTSSLSNAFVINSFISKYAFGDKLGTLSAEIYNTVYGIWNLDFFRAYLPPICLYHKQNALFVVFIEYFNAFFPFVLVIIAYILIVLYDKNFRIIVWAWRLFSMCTRKFNAKFQSKASLVDAFVTFFVLSYLKITATAFRFLQFVFVYNINGKILRTVFFYDGSVTVYQGIHLVLSILAIFTIITISFLPPFLLTCYQFKWFHSILEKCHLRSQALVTFVEVLQSGFTDGRNGTKDRRYFAGFYFILRIAIFGPTTVIPQVTIRIIIPFAVYSIAAAVLIMFPPYQKSFFNKLDVLVLLNYLVITFLILLSLIIALSGGPGDTINPFMGLAYIFAVIPFVYVIVYFMRWLLITFKIWRGNSHNNTETEFTEREIFDSTFSAPDRIIHPTLYQSLVVPKESNDSHKTTKKETDKTWTTYDSAEPITEALIRSEVLGGQNTNKTYEMSSRYSKSTN